MSVWRALGGNREVPPPQILGGAEARTEEEGGSWGEHGFPHGRKPKATDAPGGPTSEIVDFLKGKIPV
jgi:hypothetical protein